MIVIHLRAVALSRLRIESLCQECFSLEDFHKQQEADPHVSMSAAGGG